MNINTQKNLPKTVFTNYSRNVEHVIESANGVPVVLKLLEGTQGLGVVLAENKNAAQSVLEAFNGLKARVIVQEFIREAKGADIRAFIVEDNFWKEMDVGANWDVEQVFDLSIPYTPERKKKVDKNKKPKSSIGL